MKAADTAETPAPPIRRKFLLTPEKRRELNRVLVPKGYCAAISFPPDDLSGPAPRPHVVAVKLPRRNAGRPPRGGVHIPRPPQLAMRLERVSKHARQHHADGKFGNKGARTVAMKEKFRAVACEVANIFAEWRRRCRELVGYVQKGFRYQLPEAVQ